MEGSRQQAARLRLASRAGAGLQTRRCCQEGPRQTDQLSVPGANPGVGAGAGGMAASLGCAASEAAAGS